MSPLKRDLLLQDLSREHHQGLIVCWKIKMGLSKGIAPERIARFCSYFYEYYLQAHFNTEEQYLFPILGNEHEWIQQANAEHRVLRSLFEQLGEGDATEKLTAIEDLLKAHIRFEERDVFTGIQEVATQEQLRAVAAAGTEEHHRINAIEDWEDHFWE